MVKPIVEGVQVIKHGHQPMFAVVPYQQWQHMYKGLIFLTAKNLSIPTAVVSKVFRHQITPIRAWREYLGMTQQAVADALGISQAAYSQLERRASHQAGTLVQVALALGLTVQQIDW